MVSLLVPSVRAETNMSPSDLIKRMSEAVRSLNYEGSFVHSQGDNLEALHILHSNESGGERERMLSLNGEAREVYRDRALVTCIWPDSDAVIVSDSKNRNIIPIVDASLSENSAYLLKLAEPDRVAGRMTHVIDISPRDEDRYGYRFWVDKETYMLLRSMLLDLDGNIVEQVMFTNISYPEEISQERFDLPANVQDRVLSKQVNHPVKALPSKNRIEFEGLPMGYAEVSETYQPMAISERPTSHVLLSDGMASVSVYVEYANGTTQDEAVDSVSSMGGLNAYSHSTAKALITVVGEVPSNTVKTIARAVRFTE